MWSKSANVPSVTVNLLCVSALVAERKFKPRAASHFLSWVWSYALLTFVAAIRGWIESESLDANQTFLWVCFFCNNVSGQCFLECGSGSTQRWCVQQFRLLSNADGLETVFEGMLKNVKYMVAMLDTWEQPVYVTRIWTVFEQYTVHSQAGC